MRAFDLKGLLAQLNREELRFVVIGGVAVGAHGYIRATEDLDIVPGPERSNLERLVIADSELESRLVTAGDRSFDPARDSNALTRGKNLTLDTRFGGLDIVQRAAGVPSYEQLDADATDSEVLGVPLRICSLPHLRQMKQATNRSQDRADLENLPSE